MMNPSRRSMHLVSERVQCVLERVYRRILREGGLVGHLQHLYDNKDLTFGEMKDLLSRAASGRLEKVSEKMDGMNLVFTYDLGHDRLMVTRGSDIVAGGMDAASLAAKFAGRGSVEEAFNTAFHVLEEAMSALPEKTKESVFGPNGNRWYSIEVIYTKNPNVINYDSNNLVFHGWPVFERIVEDDGKVSVKRVEDDRGGVDALTTNVDAMQSAVTRQSWSVRGPALAQMRDLSDGTVLNDALGRIDSAISSVGIGDDDTMRDYLLVPVEEFLGQFSFPTNVKQSIVSRTMEDPGAPSLIDIKKMLDKETYGKVAEFVKNIHVIFKEHVRPIELAINDFAVELLRGVKSSLIADTDAEVMRLRAEVSKAINDISSSGEEGQMTILAKQMAKLGSLENITSPVEGVVFIYKGNAYKFTGSFAAANQILGIFKYGRGSQKKAKG